MAKWWDAFKIDAADAHLLCGYRIERKRRPGSTYYQTVAVCLDTRRSVSVAKLIMSPADGFVVDHINGDTLDNRRVNLRVCRQGQNVLNTQGKPTRKSRFKGVSPCRTRWRAEICKDGARLHLGVFETEIDAARAYNDAAFILHGSFARLNLIDAEVTS